MNKSDERRNYQLHFLKSNQEIEVGNKNNLPIDLFELLTINENSKYVEKYFNSGLTAHIYKLNVNNSPKSR